MYPPHPNPSAAAPARWRQAAQQALRLNCCGVPQPWVTDCSEVQQQQSQVVGQVNSRGGQLVSRFYSRGHQAVEEVNSRGSGIGWVFDGLGMEDLNKQPRL